MAESGSDNQERRKFPRVSFPCRITINSPLRLLTSHTENISEGGVRVILEEKLHLYTNVGMELFIEKSRSLKCKGKVLWVIDKISPLDNQPGLYDTGIQFVNVSSADMALIGKIVAANLPQSQK